MKSFLAIVALALTAWSCTSDPAAADAGAVVLSFNESITAQNAEAALSHVATGSVQFNLRSSHSDMGESDESLTQDLTAMWMLVTGLLFNTLDSYERTVDILDVRVDGDVATAWTRTVTRSLAEGADQPNVLEFTEVYLLLRRDGEWKISGVANNRPATAP